ncbi:MAG: hypothetical protein VZR54_02600 [Ruminococcus sp.]|nr:hypothetical protein [Ruminococcus sp.]
MTYNYNYNLDDPAVQQAAIGIGIGLIIFLLFVIAIGIVLYIFGSLGLYKIAKNRNIPNPWMAWIPVANSYLLGKIGDYYDLKNTGKCNNFAIIMLCIAIAAIAAPITVILGFVTPFAAIALCVFDYICYYKFFKNVNPDSAVVMLVLSIIFPIILPFVLFVCRNKIDILPAQAQPQYQQYQQPQYQQPQYQQPQYQQPQAPVQPQYQQPQAPVQPQYQQPQAPVQPQYQQPQAPTQPQYQQPQEQQAPEQPPVDNNQ